MQQPRLYLAIPIKEVAAGFESRSDEALRKIVGTNPPTASEIKKKLRSGPFADGAQIRSRFKVVGVDRKRLSVGQHGTLVNTHLSEAVAQHKPALSKRRGITQAVLVPLRRILVVTDAVEKIARVEVGVSIRRVEFDGFGVSTESLRQQL